MRIYLFTGDEIGAGAFALLAVGASSIAVLAAWLLSSRAERLGLVSRRRIDRFGAGAVPLTGGFGLLLGAAAALLSLRANVPHGLLIAGTGFFLVGLADDRHSLRPPLKLALQVAVAVLTLLSMGAGLAQAGLSVLLLVGCVNACNYLDNMDGLLPGVSWVMAAALAAFGMREGLEVGAGAALLMWALPGIFLLNLPPARIYLGDSGSHLVGAMLAFDALRLLFEPEPRLERALPLAILFAVPLADTATVSVSRLRRGRPLFRGGLDHLSHRIVRAGWPVPGAVALLMLGSAVCGAASLLLLS